MSLRGNWSVRRGMLLAGCAVLAAALVSLSILPRTSLFLAGVVCLLLLLPPLRRPAVIFTAVFLILGFISGAMWRQFREFPLHALARRTDTVSGQVIDQNGAYVTVRITDAAVVPEGTKLLLYCPERCTPDLYEDITAPVTLSALSDYQQYCRADGVFLAAYPTVYGDEVIQSRTGKVPLTDPLYRLRRRFITNIRARLPGDEGTLLAAVCLGDKSAVSNTVAQDFRTCGLPHLLVVSGLHLSVVAFGIYKLLKKLHLPARAVILLSTGAVLFFMLLVGLSPSVCRAGIMCGCLLMGRLTRRRADGLNSLGLAAVIILLGNPYAILDLSFQLTFAAAAGVLLFAPRLQVCFCHDRTDTRPLCRVRRFLTDGVAVTLAASLPLIPLLVIRFGRLSLISPIANLLAVVPAGWMLSIGCLSLLLGQLPLIGGFFTRVLLFPAGILARYLCRITALLSRLPLADVPIDKPWEQVLLFAACLLLVAVILRGKPANLRHLCILLALLTAGATVTDRVANRDALTITLYRYNAAVIERGGERAILSPTADGLGSVTYGWNKPVGGTTSVIIVGEDNPAVAPYLLDCARATEAQKLLAIDRIGNIADGFPRPYSVSSGTVFPCPVAGGTVTVGYGNVWRLQTVGGTFVLYPNGAVQLPGADGRITVTRPIRLQYYSDGEWRISLWN